MLSLQRQRKDIEVHVSVLLEPEGDMSPLAK